jgi:DNA-binding transcriptional ArsR family regulator
LPFADEQRHGNNKEAIPWQETRAGLSGTNARRGVQEIAHSIGIPQPNVSRELKALADQGLLEVIEKESGKTYWGKKAIDRTLRIAHLLMKEFDLDKDGHPAK